LLRLSGWRVWSLIVFVVVAGTAFALWLLPLWAWWADRNKRMLPG